MDVKKWHVVNTILNRKNVKPEEVVKITLDYAGLKEIPGWIFEKTVNVEELDLRNNAIVKVPAGIGKLKKLKLLNLERNKIDQVHPDIQQATSLSILNLRHNNLPKIPEGVCRLPQLQRLHMLQNRIRGVSADIALLKTLTLLDLGKNPLKSLPKEIGELNALQSLFLYDTSLPGLPKEIEKLGPSLWRLQLKGTLLHAHNEGNLLGKDGIFKVFGYRARF